MMLDDITSALDALQGLTPFGMAGTAAQRLRPPQAAGRGDVPPDLGISAPLGNRGPVDDFAARFAGAPAPQAASAVTPTAQPQTPEWLRLLAASPRLPAEVPDAQLPGDANGAGAPLDLAAAASAPSADDAQLPANAAPTAGTADQPAVPPSSLLGRVGGGIADFIGNNRSALMALGAGMAGAQNFGQGLQRAGTMLPAAQQQDISQQRMNATVRALVNRGLPQDAAVAAASNPALLAQILPQAFGVKQRQFTQIGEDMLGNKKFGFVDPVAGKVYNLDGSEFGAAGGGGGGAGNIPLGVDGQPLSGQPLMQHLEQTDPITAAGIRGLLQGTVNPNARNLQKLAPLAQLVDPSWNAQEFQARQKLLTSYKAGKDADEIKAINTVGGHLVNLANAADELDNYRFPWVNKVVNAVRENTGDPRVGRFQLAYNGVMDELSKAYRGGVVSDAEKRGWESAINNASSPQQMHGAIAQMADMLQSKIAASKQKYYGNMGPLAPQIVTVGDHARQAFEEMPRVFDELRAGHHVAAPGSPQAGAGGQSFQWTPQGGVQPLAPAAPRAGAGGTLAPGNYQWTPDRGVIPLAQ